MATPGGAGESRSLFNTRKWCPEMCYFLPQNAPKCVWRPGGPPGPAGSLILQPSPDPLAEFKGDGDERGRGKRKDGKRMVRGKKENEKGDWKEGRGWEETKGKEGSKNFCFPLAPNSGTLEPPLGASIDCHRKKLKDRRRIFVVLMVSLKVYWKRPFPSY